MRINYEQKVFNMKLLNSGINGVANGSFVIYNLIKFRQRLNGCWVLQVHSYTFEQDMISILGMIWVLRWN